MAGVGFFFAVAGRLCGFFLRSDHPGEMKKCVAFSAVTGSREAWLPCAELAEKDYALCRRHSDMVAGVMMGVCVSGLVEDAISEHWP